MKRGKTKRIAVSFSILFLLLGISILFSTAAAVGADPPASDTKGWYSQDSGTTNLLYAVATVDTSTAWVVGEGGTILKTINGGDIWTAQVSGTTDNILDISAASADVAFAVGNHWDGATSTTTPFVLKTTNGGSNWAYMAMDATMIYRADKVAAADANTIWVGGVKSAPAYLKSGDGGSTWTVQNTGIETNYTFSPWELVAADANNVWSVGGMGTMDYGQGFVIKTANGGTNWSREYVGPVFWYDVSTVGTQDIWIVGYQFDYYLGISTLAFSRSTNGGVTWSDIHMNEKGIHIVEAVGGGVAWVADYAANIWKTTDGGNSWTKQGGLVDAIQDLSAFDKDVAWAVTRTGGGILHTTNGGLGTPPTVTSVAPVEGSQLSFGTNITIEGSGFVSGAGVRLEKGSIVGNATNLTVVSDSQITCSVFLFGLEPGAYDVVVKNPDGQEARLAGGFTVTSACGAGSGTTMLMLGLTLGLLSLAGCGSFRKRRKVKV